MKRDRARQREREIERSGRDVEEMEEGCKTRRGDLQHAKQLVDPIYHL